MSKQGNCYFIVFDFPKNLPVSIHTFVFPATFHKSFLCKGNEEEFWQFRFSTVNEFQCYHVEERVRGVSTELMAGIFSLWATVFKIDMYNFLQPYPGLFFRV